MWLDSHVQKNQPDFYRSKPIFAATRDNESVYSARLCLFTLLIPPSSARAHEQIKSNRERHIQAINH